MAMFGALPRTASMFAQPGYGAPQGAPQITQGVPQYQSFAPVGGIAPDYKPGLSDKLAAIGGILSQLGGVQNDAFSQYRQNLQAHDLQKQKLAQEESQRQQALQDWVSKETWKRTNPDQSDLQARVEYLNTFKPGLGETYAQNYALYGGSQPMPQIVTTPQGTFMVPRTGATPQPGTPTNPTPGSIDGGFRFKGGNPADQNNWEPVGGPTPSASGTFR